MRLAVYVDDVYRRDGEVLTAGLAFPLFAAALSGELDTLTLLGRLDPRPGRLHHALPREVEFVALPYYASLSRPAEVARAVTVTLGRFWALLGRVDAVWLLGPHPLALMMVWLARARGRRVILGVRQNTIEYAAHRYARRRVARLAFGLLEVAWRALARFHPVVVVGPELAALYRRASRLLEVSVSFVGEQDLVPASVCVTRDYRAQVRLLSVGRLDPEKNPLLLADVLDGLTATGHNVRLVVCGEGSLQGELARRLDALGLSQRAELRGYLPVGEGLQSVYGSSHVFLHVSFTEGVPQVLFEAFAARLPTVATDVGGVGPTAGDAALLVPPGDAGAAVAAVAQVIADSGLRRRLVEAGAERVRRHAQEVELRRLARWLRQVAG